MYVIGEDEKDVEIWSPLSEWFGYNNEQWQQIYKMPHKEYIMGPNGYLKRKLHLSLI
jgi:hypothetical protein